MNSGGIFKVEAQHTMSNWMWVAKEQREPGMAPESPPQHPDGCGALRAGRNGASKQRVCRAASALGFEHGQGSCQWAAGGPEMRAVRGGTGGGAEQVALE